MSTRAFVKTPFILIIIDFSLTKAVRVVGVFRVIALVREIALGVQKLTITVIIAIVAHSINMARAAGLEILGEVIICIRI
jgi:hypothetical protein